MTTITTVFDLEMLKDLNLGQVLRKLGVRGDFDRGDGKMTKGEKIAMIETYTEAEQLAALLAIGSSDEDIENMRIGQPPAIDAVDAINLMDDVEEVEFKEVSKKAAKKVSVAPDGDQVAQIAGLLAQVLATNNGAIDADQVASIALEALKPELELMQERLMDIGGKNYSAMLDAISKAMDNMPARKIEVTSSAGMHVVEGRQHKQFELLLKTIGSRDYSGNTNLNVWISGGAGTGKTMASKSAATALGAKFYCNGSISSTHQLTGFVDAHSKLVRTPFRDAWEFGGVYLFDEVDGSQPAAVLSFNAALANGIMAFPDGMLERHKDCVVIAAANTMGEGATAEFVGRMKQDKAFIDRFVMIDWQLDEELETHLCHNKEWVSYVQGIRRKVVAKGIKVMVTPRATFYGAQLLANGIDRNDVITMTVKKSMTKDQWAMVA